MHTGRTLLLLSLIVLVPVFLVGVGCNDDDDDDDVVVVTNVVDNTEDDEAEPAGPSTLASGSESVNGGESLATAEAPGDGTVTGTATWDLPGIGGTVIVTVNGAELGRNTGIGGATVSGPVSAGQDIGLRVELSGGGVIDVAYSLTFNPD